MAIRKSTAAAQSVRLARPLLAKKASDQLAQPLEKDNGWVTKTRRDSARGVSRRFRDNISCCIPALRPQSPPQALADPAMALLRWIQLPVHASPSNTASAHAKIKIGTVGLAQLLANPS